MLPGVTKYDATAVGHAAGGTGILDFGGNGNRLVVEGSVSVGASGMPVTSSSLRVSVSNEGQLAFSKMEISKAAETETGSHGGLQSDHESLASDAALESELLELLHETRAAIEGRIALQAQLQSQSRVQPPPHTPGPEHAPVGAQEEARQLRAERRRLLVQLAEAEASASRLEAAAPGQRPAP